MEAKQELNQELQKMKSQLNQSERRNDEGNKQLKAMREELSRMKQENEKLKFGGGGSFLFSFFCLFSLTLNNHTFFFFDKPVIYLSTGFLTLFHFQTQLLSRLLGFGSSFENANLMLIEKSHWLSM